MNRNQKQFAWISTLLTIFPIILLGLIIIGVSRYSSISKKIFIAIYIVYLIVSLALLVMTIRVNASQSKRIRSAFLGAVLVFTALTGYGFYIVNVVNSNVDQIVRQGKYQTYEAAFVVKKGSYTHVDELKDKKIGIIESENFIEGHIMPIDENEQLKYENNEVKTYLSYSRLMNALANEEVDYISLPANYSTLYANDEQLSELVENFETIHSFTREYELKTNVTNVDINVSQEPFTMLIMGNDGGRTDSLMLATVNPRNMQITLTSIARDSYVPIACYPNQSYDKINHARTISRDCTLKTVENLMDISIDFYVEVSFQGLLDIVDALGTIPIDSPATFHGNIVRKGVVGGVTVHKGLHDLNADQVLAFVRERSSFVGGDFQRQINQQQAISSLISSIAETRDINVLLNIIKATSNNVETNMSVSQLTSLMNLAINRMESTYLGAKDIMTIYGSRITGQSTMHYSPDFDFDLYYYVPYKGSIADNKKLISMNMREDGLLEIPKAFSYSAKEEYSAPVFTSDFYYEAIDTSIFGDAKRPETSDEEKEVTLIELKGKTIEEAGAYLEEHGFTYTVVAEDIVITDKDYLDGVVIVDSVTEGIVMDEENSHINLKVIKYKYEGQTVNPDPEVDPEVPENPEVPETPENPDESKPDNNENNPEPGTNN